MNASTSKSTSTGAEANADVVRNGRSLDVDCCIEFVVRDGRVISGREYFFDLHAWDGFWAA